MSTLALNKRAVLRIRQIISQHGGDYEVGNYADSTEPVGPFASFIWFSVPQGTSSFTLGLLTPVQVCSHVRSDGRLESAGNDYKYPASVTSRLTYNFALDMVQCHMMQDMPDDPTREEWVVALELRGR